MTQALPIERIKSDVLSALTTQTTVVLSAEPGAGKSTLLPLWLLQEGSPVEGKIYLLQPRRVAVKSIASYLAQQLGESLGQSVGYRLRNEAKVSRNTRLEVVTEGILIQIMQNDPELAGVGLVILDEFHERSLQADLALAFVRDIQQGLRDDLRVLIMSATLATDTLAAQLPDAHFLQSEGRSFEVEVSYRPPANIRLWREHALSIIGQQALSHNGSILVFLPGSGDIRYIEEQLSEQLSAIADVIICPLYGELSLEQQQQAIAPCKQGKRKLVLATNIAETSLTIDGITLVIDSGLEKVANFNEGILANQLIQRSIAKSSAIQRMGRAGRISNGKCIRLFSAESFERSPMQAPLPIKHADIVPIAIEAARWGVSELAQLPLIDFPSLSSENFAWQLLEQLAIVDGKRKLTVAGDKISALPCHPRLARMIVRAQEIEQHYQQQGLVNVACLIAALLEEKDIAGKVVANAGIDFRLQLITQHWQSNKYQRIKQQAQRLHSALKLNFSLDVSHLPNEVSGALLALAYPERIAKRRAQIGQFIAANGKGLTVDDGDNLAQESWLVCAHLTQSANKNIVRIAAPADIGVIHQWQVAQFVEHSRSFYDEHLGQIKLVKQQKLGAIVVAERDSDEANDPTLIADIWLEQLKKFGVDFLPWQAQDLALLSRWRWLTTWQQQLEFPDVSELSLIESASRWFAPFVGNVKSKKALVNLSLSDMLLSLLDYQQQQTLQSAAPSHFKGPTGRRCTIRYTQDKHPIVSLPMQEVYGMEQGPTVGAKGHEISLTLELLSPAQRPIQITSDLAGFWRGSYKVVQKDMKSQYPKHYWPDEPLLAKPTNKTKRHLKAT